MPDFVYYIIGAVLAILVMLIIILSAKNSKKNKKACNEDNCDCHSSNHATQATESEEALTKEETVKEAEVESEEVAEANEDTVQEETESEEVAETPSEEQEKKQPELSKKEKLNRYRVTYDKVQENWVVKMDGAVRASKRCATKEEALKVAKELAKKKDSKLSVHKKDGKFQKKANVK